MRVLDLAAGWGRTSFELVRRGFAVTAVDLSPDLVVLGRERATQSGLPVSFVQGTARALPDLGRFDAVCAFYDDCLLSFEDEADNRAALRGVAAALRPGGTLLFGTTDCALPLPPVQTRSWREATETIAETITFDTATAVGTSVRVHRHDDGHRECFVRRRRHYRPEEAAALLAQVGLTVTGVWHAYDEGLPYGTRAEGMVIAARAGGAGGVR
jgi:SAM-dependent methyltransferase